MSVEQQADLDQTEPNGECVVSFQAELPLPLQEAMVKFIELHPNWDQYRLCAGCSGRLSGAERHRVP